MQIYNTLMFIADNWSEKACRRRTQGVGRMRYMKKVFRRFRYADCTNLFADGYNLKSGHRATTSTC